MSRAAKSSWPMMPHGRWLSLAILAAIALAWAVLHTGTRRGRSGPGGLLDEVAGVLPPPSAAEPRISIFSGRPSPCSALPWPASAFARSCTPGEPNPVDPRRVRRVALRAEVAARDSQDAEAMHALGLLNLLSGGPVKISLPKAISYLRTAAALSDHPAPALADLSAAHLYRAESAGTPRDLLTALETAEEALEHEPGNRDALFNRALAMQRFGLVDEAVDAWRGYLAADPASPSAGFARHSLRELEGIPAPPSPPSPDAAAAEYASYAAADPQGGRTLGWCRELGDWGGAVMEGDATRAGERLLRAEALGLALERRGGDASLADAVRAIRRTAGDGLRRLARGHRAFAAGCALDDRLEYAAAALRFRAAGDDARGSRALLQWTRLRQAGAVFHDGHALAGEEALRAVLAGADAARYPALVGQAHQLVAMVMLRGDRYEGMLEQARMAEDRFVAAGERENRGVALDAEAMALFAMGDPDAGYFLSWRALQLLRPYRGSYRLHNLFGSVIRIAAADGFSRASLRVAQEGVRVAERTGTPWFAVEAYLAGAQRLAARGDVDGAARDVAAARGPQAQIRAPRSQAWMAAQRQMAEAGSTLRNRPDRAAEALDSATAFFASLSAPFLALPPLVEAARAWLQAGDTARAGERLQRALVILEHRRDSLRMEPRRAATFEVAREVVDRIAMLRLAAGDTAGALAVLDRGRASLATTGRDAGEGATGVVTAPPGEVAIEYALVADTLSAWTVRGTRVTLYRTVVDTLRLARATEKLLRLLEQGAGEGEVRPELSRMYELLLRPIEERIGMPGTPLVVIADGAIASVPFGALYDARRGRYLVEDRSLRWGVSLRDARRRPGARIAEQGAAFVADPAFSQALAPEIGRLPAAAREAREIAAGYPGAPLLEGTAGTRAAVLEVLGRSRIFHYAGHAVFDDERPERSYLLLAPGSGDPGLLRADEIAQLDLGNVALVVLSACRTIRTGGGRAAGFSGLSGAFLAAGAGGAVGSLWEVDDPQTRPLMTEFHRVYRLTGNGPAALRAAQLKLLRSNDADLRSPAAWAGFRYAGQ